jgi:hypothetical protein
VCPANLQNINDAGSNDYGDLTVSCSPQDGIVSNISWIFWQRSNPNGSGGWQKFGSGYSWGSLTFATPFYSGEYGYGCKKGWQNHVEMKFTVTTPDGGGSYDSNTANGTCLG